MGVVVRNLRIIISILCLSWIEPSAWAHPVTYQDGWAIMTWNQPSMTDTWISYSATSSFAGTARYMQMRESESEKRELYLPQVNFLLKRWNMTGSQSNIYLFGGYGVEKLNGETSEGVALGAVEMDWESRKLYGSAEYQALRLSQNDPLDLIKVRGGFAPYLTEFENLHTWFMVQVDHRNRVDTSFAEDLTVTPLLRFIYQNVLWEVGSSLDGEWMLNFMVHL